MPSFSFIRGAVAMLLVARRRAKEGFGCSFDAATQVKNDGLRPGLSFAESRSLVLIVQRDAHDHHIVVAYRAGAELCCVYCGLLFGHRVGPHDAVLACSR